MTEFINSILSAGALLDTEHGLVMLLLLYGLLTYRDEKVSGWVPLVILGGILLSLATPVHEIKLFWPVITGLVVPPFLWQAAVAVTKSGPLRGQWSLVVWAVTLVLVTIVLWVFGGISVSTAMLFGILTVTLVWYFRELKIERSYLSTIGLITLVVLLTEVDLALVSLRFWLGSLLSGAAIGIAFGFLGVAIYRRLRITRMKDIFFFFWAYLAYLTGLAFDTSAIVTTLAAAQVVSTYGFSIGLWVNRKDIPIPANFPLFFYLSAGVWITLGWQAHTVFDPENLIGIFMALAVVTISVLVIWKVAPISTENRLVRLIRKETGVFLLLFGGAIFWPQQAFLTTISVEIALGAGILLIFLLRFSLQPVFDLIGVQLSWPEKD
jgi:hypothetical protein